MKCNPRTQDDAGAQAGPHPIPEAQARCGVWRMRIVTAWCAWPWRPLAGLERARPGLVDAPPPDLWSRRGCCCSSPPRDRHRLDRRSATLTCTVLRACERPSARRTPAMTASRCFRQPASRATRPPHVSPAGHRRPRTPTAPTCFPAQPSPAHRSGSRAPQGVPVPALGSGQHLAHDLTRDDVVRDGLGSCRLRREQVQRRLGVPSTLSPRPREIEADLGSPTGSARSGPPPDTTITCFDRLNSPDYGRERPNV